MRTHSCKAAHCRAQRPRHCSTADARPSRTRRRRPEDRAAAVRAESRRLESSSDMSTQSWKILSIASLGVDASVVDPWTGRRRGDPTEIGATRSMDASPVCDTDDRCWAWDRVRRATPAVPIAECMRVSSRGRTRCGRCRGVAAASRR